MAKTSIAEMDRKSKHLVIAAALLLYANFMLLSYALGVAHPTKLAAIGGMPFFSLANAINAMGVMITLSFAGSLADRFGRKRIVIAGLGLHILCLTVTGFSTSPVLFLAAFFFAGTAAGLYLAAPYVIIAEMADPEKRGRFYGLLSTCAALGCLAGPVISGFLVDRGHYRLSYMVGLPLAAVVICILTAKYPNRKGASPAGQRMDIPGIFLLVLTIGCVVGYLNFGGSLLGGLGSPTALAVLAAGLVLAVLLVRRESRHPNPSVPVKLFKKRNFTVSFLSMLLFSFYSGAAAAFIILFAQNVMGISATLSATLAMPQTICQALLGATVGIFFAKDPARRLRPMFLGALAAGSAALFLWSTLSASSSILVIYLGMVLGGAGTALYQTVFTPFFQMALRQEEYGAAQNLYSFASSSGSCIFSAIAGLVLAGGSDYGAALTLVFRIAAIAVAGALVMAFFLVRVPRSAPAPAEESV